MMCGEMQSRHHLLITLGQSEAVGSEVLRVQYDGDDEPITSKDEDQSFDPRRMTQECPTPQQPPGCCWANNKLARNWL